ncbi:hypothetical protein [Chryseobacterium chendengshani]|uniref:hypothetical protein n=1 Tax=Chryseobacterium sp. LJ668 TaxID=2864040 RepID=UPI001C689095|nr:hypothetical protein [Chryseobacterium sp. LJ668]MBW8524218.1 hypothetical protein [Chryseobacterium sp. LJ668]
MNLSSQETYVNNATAYYNGKGEFENLLNNNISVNEIILNPDFTYEMWMRPHVGCLTWRSFKGTWKKKGDELLFTDKYDVQESDSREIYRNKNIDKYILAFKTDQKIVMKDLKVKINYEYDFDSKIKFDDSIDFVTDKNGNIEISFSKIPNQTKLASLRFETNYDDRKIYGYLTENETVNKKISELPNIITIIIREKPLKETVIRTVSAIKKNDELQIISVYKTSGSLPDYNKELKLEKSYKLKNPDIAD